MFNVGDIVEITEKSSATGMLDFVDGKGYAIRGVGFSRAGLMYIKLVDESGRWYWYTASHFKLKEVAMQKDLEDVTEFKVGDVVICTETDVNELGVHSITTGREYIVKGLWEHGVTIESDNEENVGVYGYRFKLKETVMEKKECLFKEGQVVWDVAFGEGVVRSVTNRNDPDRPITVDFNGDLLHYTKDGAYSKQRYRTLYFSEPKIEAATEPLFEPVLKKGDKVVVEFEDGSSFAYIVKEELEDRVLTLRGDLIYKHNTKICRVGEKIEFN